MTKRIIAVLFAVIMIVALVGCGSSQREVIKLTLSTEDAAAILSAAGIRLPDAEDAAGAGTTVQWFAHYDVFQNYSEDEIVNTGAWTFIEKYGGSFKWIETLWENRFTDLANLIMADTSPDMFPGENAIFPYYAIKGVFQPVNDYIDYDDPLWSGMKDYAYKYFNLGGDIYAAVYNANYGIVCPYNRRVIEEWGFADPAELFYNDEWTWDVFYDMCLDFTDPDDDRYALDGFWTTIGIMYSSGKTAVELDPDTCQFYSNIDDPGLERAANVLNDLARNECFFPRWTNNWNCRDNSTAGAGIKDGKCLFYGVGAWGFTGTVDTVEAVWGDLDRNELMFVPMPRDPNGDGNYYIESTADAYAIVKGSRNVEGAALVCACERFKAIDPVVKAFDRRQLMETYKWNQDMIDMADICYEIVTSSRAIVAYGDGMGANLSTINGQFVPAAYDNTNPTSWAQLKEANEERLQFYIDDFNAQIQAFINGEDVNI